MKAVIFNSGYGKRMGEFTKTHHKSQAPLKNGETIYERQLRLLSECGITDFVVTTGPFKEQLMEASEKPQFSHLNFVFVENPIFDKTNYIYSMYLAREYLDDDVLLMHGDLVFNKRLLKKVLLSELPCTGMVNMKKELPEKDFKARVVDGKIQEVSIHIFDQDCCAFQPLYKLSRETLGRWMAKVEEFIQSGNDQVYAENALNEIAGELDIQAFSYEDDFVDEVDNLEDLERVSSAIRQFDFNEQIIFSEENAFLRIPQILKECRVKKPMIVCGFLEKVPFYDYLQELQLDYIPFKGYSANPSYEQVAEGVRMFRQEECDFIISIGGGSAIDTAKNIKLFAGLDEAEGPYVKQELHYSPIKHLCIPGTAGTGSESTRYSVVYYEGEKCSVTHDSAVPDYVILEPSLLEGLSDYQKKCTVMDALSQCVEAVWSVNTSEECRDYAVKGIRLILGNMMPYLRGEKEALRRMQLGANYSGKAINISQTTAGHAMSYKLTTLYGIPHGFAVALCLPKVWAYMDEQENLRREKELHARGITDTRDPKTGAIKLEKESVAELPILKNLEGKKAADMDKREILVSAFEILKAEFGAKSTMGAVRQFEFILRDVLELECPPLKGEEDLEILSGSVNPVRLGNTPEHMDERTIRRLYEKVFGIVPPSEIVEETEEQKKKWKRLRHEVKELQSYTLEILLQLDAFCKEHEIRYYLAEGTLLGAIRHQGFIPWDDDVDIMMPRESYDKFVQLGMKGIFPEGLALDCYENNPKHWVLAAKVQMKRQTKFVQEKTYGLTKYHGPYVDVFPLDYVPSAMSRKQLRQGRETRLLRRLLFMKTKYSPITKGKLHRYAMKAAMPFMTTKMLHKRLDKVLRRFETRDENGCLKQRKYLAGLTSYYPCTKETFPTSFYGEPRYVPFMGHMLPVPCEAEYMLKTIYGRYYDTIPPYKVTKSRKHAFVIHEELADEREGNSICR